MLVGLAVSAFGSIWLALSCIQDKPGVALATASAFLLVAFCYSVIAYRITQSTFRHAGRWGWLSLVSSIALFLLCLAISKAFVESRFCPQADDPGGVASSTPTPPPLETLAATEPPTPVTVLPTNSSGMYFGDFVATYYEVINNAGNPDDLAQGFYHLSYGLQGASNHSIDEYKNWWFMFQVQYKIYTCPDDVVYVELMYFRRGNDFTKSTSTDLVSYEMAVEDHEWIFTGRPPQLAVSSTCTQTPYATNISNEDDQ